MANIGVNNDIIINFDSHGINNDNEVFKFIENQSLINAKWLKVSELKVGDEIAIPDYERCNIGESWKVKGKSGVEGGELEGASSFQLLPSSSCIKWAKIVSIKVHEPQQVYDLEIENTHNFIANDIIAHNTFSRYFQ
ncbi:MAG: hypothetical protein HY929_05485 [Euryarchaeota archaeon]|nr:hypothetical protein [Euryarchaeota archaeon]